MQKELLKMFSFNHSDNYATEIKKVICDYYQQKIDKELEILWENGTLNQEKLDEIRKKDLHQLMREDAKTYSGH